MDAINARLQQLRELENIMLSDRKALIALRAKEDRELQNTRAKEDEEWTKRIEARDYEEDALFLRKRELSRLWMTWTSTAGPPVDGKEPPFSTVFRHGSGQVHSPVTVKQEDPLKTSRKRKSTHSVPSKKCGRNLGNPQTADTEGPLYLRQSDNKLVHLYCCVIGCNKAHFKSVTSLMSHIANPRYHGFGKGYLLKDQADAIEKCGRLPGDEDSENFFQVSPRELPFPSRHTGLTDASEIISTSLVRIGEAGVFSKIIERTTTSTSSEAEIEKELAYSTGVGVLSLDEETEPRYMRLSEPSTHGIPSMGLSPEGFASQQTTSHDSELPSEELKINQQSPKTASHEVDSAAPTRLTDSGNQVLIKDEPKDELAAASLEQSTPH